MKVTAVPPPVPILAQDQKRWQALANVVMNLWVPWNAGNFLTS